MPLHEVHRRHWLLFGADLTAQKYFVYDSFSSTVDADRADLVRYAVSCTPPLNVHLFVYLSCISFVT